MPQQPEKPQQPQLPTGTRVQSVGSDELPYVNEVEAALAAPGVIKNRSKARCAVTNARAFLAVAEEWGSFARYLWHWVDGVPVDHRLERPEDMPAEDDLSRRVSADLKKRGFRFVGPVIVYSYLQGAGLINDHLVTCPWHGEGL